jgi:hypothetical protein
MTSIVIIRTAAPAAANADCARYGGAMRDEPGSEVECSVGGTLPGGTTAGIPRDLSEGGC